jgi:hypothetical protein
LETGNTDHALSTVEIPSFLGNKEFGDRRQQCDNDSYQHNQIQNNMDAPVVGFRKKAMTRSKATNEGESWNAAASLTNATLEQQQCYTLSEYTNMFERASDDFALSKIEYSSTFRSAKGNVDAFSHQSNAIYGRIQTTAAHYLLNSIAQLTPRSVICDLGHGIGNLIIQAAYTIGCECRGIELISARHSVAEALLDHFKNSYPV